MHQTIGVLKLSNHFTCLLSTGESLYEVESTAIRGVVYGNLPGVVLVAFTTLLALLVVSVAFNVLVVVVVVAVVVVVVVVVVEVVVLDVTVEVDTFSTVDVVTQIGALSQMLGLKFDTMPYASFKARWLSSVAVPDGNPLNMKFGELKIITRGVPVPEVHGYAYIYVHAYKF